ncbi:MAG: HAD family phosphatase [Planctomycetes bacterium]|nr:HAD family phosphatase [Planctomycetota bacterium]
MPPARAIIFDFDGVLADTEPLHSETFRRVLAEEGIHLTDREHTERFIGINDRAGFEKAFAEAGRELLPDALEGLLARKSAYYSARVAEVPLFPGVLELVQELSSSCLLAIASGGREVEIDAVLARHRIGPRFQAIVSADRVARSKPAPDVFLEAVARLRACVPGAAPELVPAACVAVEDSATGIEAALAAGLRCVAVAHSFPAERLRRAHRVVERIGLLTADALLGEGAR